MTSRVTTALAKPDGPGISYGSADFVAAEEMGRMRGYWWSPDGNALLVARVDDSPVPRWHIADPEHPERAPTVVAYPAAGTRNARVDLQIIALDGSRTRVRWDAERDEYLVTAVWDSHELLIVVQPRDQRALRVLRVEPGTGATSPRHEQTDPAWVDIVPGVPAHTAAGALLTTADADGARRLVVDGQPVTPPGLQVRAVLDVDGDTALLSAGTDPCSIGLYSWSAADGLTELTTGPGCTAAGCAGGTLVVARQDLDTDGTTTTVHPDRGGRAVHPLVRRFAPAHPADPLLSVGRAGAAQRAAAAPDHRSGTPLPVLMDPYGGPPLSWSSGQSRLA